MAVGRIYKIICGLTNDIYVGSTLNVLKHRFNGHKTDYKRWLNDRSKACFAIFPLFEQYGLESFKIILIKEYDVVDRSHLHALEQLWMNKLKRCTVNVQAAFIPTSNAYKELVLKVAVSARMKVYREANRDVISAKNKLYREANRDELNAKKKVKHTCDCGGRYIHSHRSRHLKSKKHQHFVESQ